MRISHNTLQAYLKAGVCAAAKDIGACLQTVKKSGSVGNGGKTNEGIARPAEGNEEENGSASHQRLRQRNAVDSLSHSVSSSSMMGPPAFHPPNHFLRAAKAAAATNSHNHSAPARAGAMPRDGDAAALPVDDVSQSLLLSRALRPPLNRALMLVS